LEKEPQLEDNIRKKIPSEPYQKKNPVNKVEIYLRSITTLDKEQRNQEKIMPQY